MGQTPNSSEQMKIQIFHIGINQLKSDYPLEARLFSYPERNFALNSQQKPLSQLLKADRQSRVDHFSFQTGFYESVQMNLPIFGYLSEALLNQIQQIQIKDAIMDEIIVDKALYSTNKATFSIRTFTSTDHYIWLNNLYMTYNLIKIGQLSSPYLHKMQKYFCISPTNQHIKNFSHVVFYEPIQINLSTIIKIRRQQKRVWTMVQFYSLMHNLVEAVAVLHKNGYAHNDIRPSNIYYSTKRSSFLLGFFQKSTIVCPQNIKTARGKQVGQKKSPNFLKTQGVSDKTDPMKDDVYALGMALMSSFYLYKPISRQKCAPYNRSLLGEYPILKIIKMMVTSNEKRATIFEIKQAMIDFQTNYNIKPEMHEAIYEKSSIFVDISKRERFIADGYKHLGLIKQWKERLDNRYIQKKLSDKSVETAKYFQELAIISCIEGKSQKSSNYYIRSAEMYQNLGNINFKQRDYEKSINYFLCGLQNFNMVENKYTNLIFLKLVVSLMEAKIISGYQLIPNQDLHSIQSAIEGIRQIEPFAYYQFLTQFINIHKYYENYKKVNELLERQLDCSVHVQTKIEEIIIMKEIIENNIKTIQNEKIIYRQQNKLVSRTQKEILTILNDKEYYFIERPVERFDMMLMQARVKIIKNLVREGIALLEDLLKKLQMWMDPVEDSKFTDQKNHFMFLKCEVLEQMGWVYFNQNQLNQSMTYYSKALQHYRDYFGDIYNIQCARVLESIGNINKLKGLYDAQFDCLELVRKIFKIEYFKYHKDILRLNREQTQTGQNSHYSRRGSIFKMDTDLSILTDQ